MALLSGWPGPPQHPAQSGGFEGRVRLCDESRFNPFVRRRDIDTYIRVGPLYPRTRGGCGRRHALGVVPPSRPLTRGKAGRVVAGVLSSIPKSDSSTLHRPAPTSHVSEGSRPHGLDLSGSCLVLLSTPTALLTRARARCSSRPLPAPRPSAALRY